MALIFYYVGFMAAGDIAAYLLGSRVRMGLTVESGCLSGSVFCFLVGRMDTRRLGFEAKDGLNGKPRHRMRVMMMREEGTAIRKRR